MFADDPRCRVRQAPFRGDEKIPLMNLLNDANLLNPVVRHNIRQAGDCGRKNASSAFAESIHQGAIIEFSNNRHPDPLSL